MKKHVFLRLSYIIALYIAVFVILSLVQWTAQDSFTRKIGAMIVTGKYSRDEKGRVNKFEQTQEGEYANPVSVRVLFNGVEFAVNKADLHAYCVMEDGARISLRVKTMMLNADCVKISLEPEANLLSDMEESNIELSFYLQDENETLLISSVTPQNVREIEVPFSPSKKASASINEGKIYISLSGANWGFDRAMPNLDAGFFTLSKRSPVIAYRPHFNKNFNPIEFIATGAMEKQRFDEIVAAWKSKVYSTWNGLIPSVNDEITASAWVAESAERGNLKQAVSRLPNSFVNSASRTYFSSPYLGRLPIALRSKNESEQAAVSRLTALLRSNPEAFLLEENVFIYISQRGYTDLFNEAIRYIKNMQSDAVTEKLLASIFEGWRAWNVWHEDEENPFEPLVSKAKSIISELIKKDEENGDVFIVSADGADVLYNVRLGAALNFYGRNPVNNEWAALGRSFILSSLAYSDDSGVIPAVLRYENGVFLAQENAGRLNPLQIYVIAAPSDYFPHAVGVSTLIKGVWIWTMSPSIGASFENNVLDFAFSFPPGGAHHMLISGIKPFSKIQIREMDYRSDPQFENWNAPGWIYSPSEQTLLIKLVHRNEIERVKIFF
ncbi:MAG: hypothetical protein LBC53_07160 [Spirochaetaceae bacterium]|nr:hypothetical protein [Spirochaetaceae bacterium]